MKLGVITAIHNREDMTIAFLYAMNRLRVVCDVELFVSVTHGDASIKHLDDYKFSYTESINFPLGNKWNTATEMVRDSDVTHVMILGSDDIPSTEFIENAISSLGEYDISGVDGIWFWGLNPRRAGFKRFGFFPVKVMMGCGKILSRKVLEACDYRPWPEDCNYGMDAKMMQRVRTVSKQKGIGHTEHKYSLKEKDGFIVDIKYETHISSMSPILRRPQFDEQDVYKVLPHYLPEDECDYLFSLQRKANDR